jgi:hypothetical protein
MENPAKEAADPTGTFKRPAEILTVDVSRPQPIPLCSLIPKQAAIVQVAGGVHEGPARARLPLVNQSLPNTAQPVVLDKGSVNGVWFK